MRIQLVHGLLPLMFPDVLVTARMYSLSFASSSSSDLQEG